MTAKIEKFCLQLIFLGLGLSLITPLLVDNRFFFPFISTKVFWFRLIVEVMLVVYLFLVYLNSQYRPKLNYLTVLLTIFVAVALISSYFGPNFYGSFFGNMERGEGVVLWLHLLVFMLILTSVLKEEKIWLRFFDFSLVISFLLCLFSLGQLMHLGFILSTTGQRTEATIGNPAFLAAYLIFHLAFAVYLWCKKTSSSWRFYYTVLALLFVYIIFQTQTRGAVLGLIGGVLISSFLSWLLLIKNKKVKLILPILLVIILGGSFVFLYLNRHSTWLQNYPALQRVASISTQEATAQTRLAAWQAAWTGWRQHFLWGYGLENYHVVFDKNFPPAIYQDEGSAVWFDRAHNIIFDRGVTTGVIGLVVYLAFLFWPLYYFWFQQRPKDLTKAIIFTGLVVAFFIQDLFVFETITTYIILMFAWAFLAYNLKQLKFNKIIPEQKFFWLALAVIGLILFFPVVNWLNILPAKNNMAAAAVMQYNPNQDDFFKNIEAWQAVLAVKDYGLQEYRAQYIDFFDQQLANLGEVVPAVKTIVNYTDQQVAEQIKRDPTEAKNYLIAMRHYDYTFAMDANTKVERLNQALSFLPPLENLTPTRPHIYQEAGYAHLYLYRIYLQDKNQAQMAQEATAAEKYFCQVITLNPQVVESYINLIMLYLNEGRTDLVNETLVLMEQNKIDYRQSHYLSRLISLALGNKNYKIAALFTEELVKLEPDNIETLIKLATFYAYDGQRQSAIAIANKVKEFGSDYSQQADLFIAKVNSGYYEKK
ncbi:MAG: O-antigen ligase family protein [Candidatus Buchananbacteria bacterium]